MRIKPNFRYSSILKIITRWRIRLALASCDVWIKPSIKLITASKWVMITPNHAHSKRNPYINDTSIIRLRLYRRQTTVLPGSSPRSPSEWCFCCASRLPYGFFVLLPSSEPAYMYKWNATVNQIYCFIWGDASVPFPAPAPLNRFMRDGSAPPCRLITSRGTRSRFRPAPLNCTHFCFSLRFFYSQVNSKPWFFTL